MWLIYISSLRVVPPNKPINLTMKVESFIRRHGVFQEQPQLAKEQAQGTIKEKQSDGFHFLIRIS